MLRGCVQKTLDRYLDCGILVFGCARTRCEKCNHSIIAQVLSQSHTGFSAWMGDAIEPGDDERRLFVSRYIDRGPVASSKIEITDDIISYNHQSDHLPTAEFDPVEFLAALSVHIPNKWEQLTRHYGYG